MPRIPTVAAALSGALALAAPCGAAPAAPPSGSEGCAPMMAEWQGKEAATSAIGDADLRAYNDVQNDIDHAAHLCEGGQDAEARAVMLRSKDPARLGP